MGYRFSPAWILSSATRLDCLQRPHVHADAPFCGDFSSRIHVVHRETRKNTAIERFVNPPDSTAPNGAGALSTSGETNISTAGFANAVHLGYHVFPSSTRPSSRMAPR